MFVIQCKTLEEAACGTEKQYTITDIFPGTESSAGLGKIRYVGAFCIAKCRHKLCSSIKNLLFAPEMDTEINKLNELIQILDGMILTASDIKAISKYQESLNETARKQNIREGLTNINDEVFEFFLNLEKEIRQLMTYSTLQEQNKHLYKHVIQFISNKRSILEMFIQKCVSSSEEHALNSTEPVEVTGNHVCKYLTSFCEHILELFENIVRLFVTVILSQFRKDYLRVIQRVKGKALRKKVIEKYEKKMQESITFQFIKADTSKNKAISHHKLKAVAMQNEQFYTSLKKDDLIILLKAYNVEGQKRSKKTELGEKLVHVLKNESCVSMLNTSVLGETLEQEASAESSVSAGDTSNMKTQYVKSTKGKQLVGKRKATKKSTKSYESSQQTDTSIQEAMASCSYKTHEDEKCKPKTRKRQTEKRYSDSGDYGDACGVCMNVYETDEDWICCDSCCTWYHRDCIGLEDEEWNYFSDAAAIYICPICQ
jgi:hypothetical protein